MDEAADDAEMQARMARERFAVLNAIVTGQRRDAEVSAALWAAEDHRAAIAAVAELLDIELPTATAVYAFVQFSGDGTVIRFATAAAVATLAEEDEAATSVKNRFHVNITQFTVPVGGLKTLRTA